MEMGFAVTIVPDSTVGFIMEKVDYVLVGAEAVVENGGIINKVRRGPTRRRLVRKSSLCRRLLLFLHTSRRGFLTSNRRRVAASACHCQVGTNTIAIVAKAANKPVYVAAESYKFARMYPLRQDDVPNPDMAEKLACGQEVRHQARMLERLPRHSVSTADRVGTRQRIGTW